LVDNYRAWSDAATKSGGSPAKPVPSASVIEQFYGYLEKLAVNFGVISSLDVTYIVQCDGYELSISKPIEWNSGNLVAALAFLIHLAAQPSTSSLA
jgi:hypothetical protein